MKLLKLVPDNTVVNFIGRRVLAFALSGFLVLASFGLFFTQGLNLGIDFLGGILIEIKTDGPADLSKLRSQLNNLGLGDVTLQEFGTSDDVLIRIQKQDGGDSGQQAAIDAVKSALGDGVLEYRRTEFVGPTVGAELRESATYALLAAMLAILVYVWFRFEWQFGIGAVLALLHDVITTIGLFSLIQLEFNLATVAAVLTIAGYSINDTVVVYDRVRENMRRYKKMPLPELFNNSLNQTLSRTVMTSVTTLLALFALYAFGGEVIRGFSIALIWGVIIGTYSSISLAVPFLLYVRLERGSSSANEDLDKIEAS
ncbi:MAG: protein translocase subunit SecF [Alphaproteobacteria bacterium]|nr:protein translocase subunit SecF [Alphaproteobacteria bacterium]